MINKLISVVDSFPICREKNMLVFYLEELKYRFWHYKLGPLCCCTDLDFIEYRYQNNQPRVVGLFEVKTPLSARLRPRTKAQKLVLFDVARKLNLPLWLVTFTSDLSMFDVERMDVLESSITFTESEYIAFMKKLE